MSPSTIVQVTAGCERYFQGIPLFVKWMVGQAAKDRM